VRVFGSIKKGAAALPAETLDEDAVRRRGRDRSGKYRLLYEYLERRYADKVVLTFGQIEDLLGFTLPDQARTDPGWWSSTVAASVEPCYSSAWTLAKRSAKPNLPAGNVAFDRLQ
jgi:hypothetical protein